MRVDDIKSYGCTTCDVSLRLEECEYDDYEEKYTCPHCNNFHVEVQSERPARWFSVAIYEVHRAYGGPEEGGWYYDVGNRINETVRTFQNSPEGRYEAERYLESLHALQFPRSLERWFLQPHTSRVFSEQLPDGHFPKRRPVYC